MVNAADLKSAGVQAPCRFESGHRHQVNQGFQKIRPTQVDTPTRGMHDKSMTESGVTPQKKGQPFARVKHGSAVVPIYRGKVHKWVRYTVAFHMNGKRVRRTFGSLEKAKAEAQLIARKIQEGLSATNDLRPQEREAFLTARGMLLERDLDRKSVV